MVDLRLSAGRLIRAAAITGGLALAACAPNGLADQIAREQAKDAIRPVLAKQFSSVPLEPATDCVIDSASAGEILQLAAASVTGIGAEEVKLILEIVTRKKTVECLIEEGIAMYLLLET